MSTFQFDVSASFVGGNSPTSAAFESIATKTLQGVQSANVALIYQRGEAFSIDGAGNQELIERPQAELQLSALFTSGTNELALGFNTSPSGTISALAGMNDERNYYLITNQDHQDAFTYGGTNSYVLALGNGVLTHYDLAAQVGQPTITNFSILGLNLLVQQSGVNQILPAVLKQSGVATTGVYTIPQPANLINSYFECAPSAIQLTFDSGSAVGVALSGQNACPVDSFSFSMDLPRAEVKDLGWAYPNVRPVQWPVTIGIKADAFLNAFQLDALNRVGTPDSGYSFTVAFNRAPSGSLEDFKFRFNGAKMENESISVSVGGGAAKVTFDWSLKIYDINRTALGNPNFFINVNGTPYTSIIFPQVQYVTGQTPLTFNLSTGSYLSILSGPGIISGGNNVLVTDSASTVVVRAIAADGSDTEDLTVTVG